jgi:hypothetical protein
MINPFWYSSTPAPPPGGDPYFYDVVLLLHCDGTDGSTTFIDSSSAARSMTAFGAAQVDTSIAKFGTGGMQLGATVSDYVDAAASADFALNADYTIEFWYYPEATPNTQSIIDLGGAFSGINVRASQNANNLSVWIRGTLYERSYTWSLNTWHYVAITRSGSNLKFWVNGTQLGSTMTNASTFASATPALRIGHIFEGGAFYQARHIDDIRITKGIARDVSSVPTEAFPDS